ncbi:MAG: VWA domain-containing protein [Planctomycetota bacterium]
MTLLSPGWLLLVLPAAFAVWRFRPSGVVLLSLRAVVALLVVVSMAEPVVEEERLSGTVVVVVDRSLSMPAGSDERHLESIALLDEAASSDDRLAVVAFGRESFVELGPGGLFGGGFVGVVDPSASSLSVALGRALSLIAEGEPGRVLVLSDGRVTDSGTAGVTAVAAARSIAIDYRSVEREAGSDLAVVDVEAPSQVGLSEAFVVHGWVSSPAAQEVVYELRRGGVVIARGTREVPAGRSRLTFRDAATAEGLLSYELSVESRADDPVPENNRASFLVGRRDAERVLLVTETPGRGLAELLRGSGLSVDAVGPSEVDGSLEWLASYAAVVLENVPARELGPGLLSNLAVLVRERGTGLLMTGGRRSYAAGGYYGSAIDPVLPVSMELRSEFRQLSAAIVVAMDRSGSMAARVAGGRTKMELAGLASSKVLEIMTDLDEFGAIAVDSAPHIVVPLSPAGDVRGEARTLRRLESMGGGIFVDAALQSAVAMLRGSESASKHIILFADAADAERPGNYRELLSAATAAGMTCSVIGLGTPADADAVLLRDIAARGDGEIYFTTDAARLPEIFTEDAVAVTRGAFLEQPTALTATGQLVALLGSNPGELPLVGGYNPLYAKPGARVAAVTRDEYSVPFLTDWNAGLGRVVTVAGEADGEFSGGLPGWDGVGGFWAGLVRSLMIDEGDLGRSVYVEQRVDGGELLVDVHIDPERLTGLSGGEVVVTRRSRVGVQSVERVRLVMESPELLRARVPLGRGDTVVPTVRWSGGRVAALPAARLPYEPEYRPSGASGRSLLAGLARRTGGVERADLASVWDDLPVSLRRVSLAPWLLGAAMLLLLFEVAERRIGLLPAVVTARRLGAPFSTVGARRARRGAGPSVRGVSSLASPPADKPSGISGAEKSAPPSSGGVLDALSDVSRSD